MYEMIPISNINGMSTLNSTFPALSHAQLTIYSTGDENGWRKTKDLPQWSASFTLENHPQNVLYFDDRLLPLVNWYLWFELKPEFCMGFPQWFETEILQGIPPLSSIFLFGQHNS